MKHTPPDSSLPRPRIATEDASVVRARGRQRAGIVGALLAVFMGGIGLRGVQLALDPDARVLDIAAEKRWKNVSTQGPRGTVLDHDGNVLAESVKQPAISVDPVAMRERAFEAVKLEHLKDRLDEATLKRVADEGARVALDQTGKDLAGVLVLPLDEVLSVLHSERRYVRLARNVHPEVADQIRDLGLLDKGVIIEENYRRFYPQGGFAAQLVGFVDDNGIGRQGLEQHFEEELAGSSLETVHRVNRWGSLLELFRRDERTAGGHAIKTTIDHTIQQALERSLAVVMEQSKPISATAVVVEVRTGRIVAMATAPQFDPNHLTDDFTNTHNIAVGSATEPGSVLKPFTMAGAVAAGAVTPDDIIETSSPYQMYGVSISDDHPHPALTVSEIIKYSSNIGASKIAAKMGGEALYASMESFGFGTRLEIETQGEAPGVRHPWGKPGPVELATVSFGQGCTATPLQLAMATATIANGGVRMRPMIIDEIDDAFGRVVRKSEPIEVRRVVSAQVAAQVTRAMEMVIEEGGTGTRAAIPGYKVAGKTGTAQKPKNGTYSAARYSSFIGFAPSNDPVFAMAIVVDEATVGSRYGGVVAAPVFAEVVGEALRLYHVAPDPALLPVPKATHVNAPALAPSLLLVDANVPEIPAALARVEDEDAPNSPVRMSWMDGAWALPDLNGRPMRDVLAGLQRSGLTLHVEGTGRLASMDPMPGTWVVPGETVQLRFQ